MRRGWFLIVVAVALMGAGGFGVVRGIGNREPQTLSCAEFYAQRPSAAWLRLTDCRIRLFDAAYRESFGAVREVLAPVVPTREDATIEIRLVVATRDPDALALVKEMRVLDKKDDPGAGLAFLAKNAKRMVASRDIQGTLRTEVDRGDPAFVKLRDLENNLVRDFAVLDEGRNPSLVGSLSLLAGALLLGALGLVLIARAGARRAARHAAESDAGPAGAAAS
jgi:hypothetical protein